MSTSKEGQQRCLNNLEIYCDKWKLKLNIKKTKVVIFNRQGSLITKHHFVYKINRVEVVREYKYLGFVFACSGSTNAGITNLINQAKKAWFSVQHYLSFSKNKHIDTYIKLFDSLVKPILLYACEAWADSLKIDNNIKNLLLRNKLEKFQITVMKQLLAVSRKTTNLSILLELGRYPITINMQYQAIKYFTRFPYLNKDRLLYKSYEEEIKSYENKNTNFISYIVKTLNNIGMSNIWITQIRNPKSEEPKKSLTTKILTRLRDISTQSIFQETHNPDGGKLQFLNSLKDTYHPESYLKIKKLENRRALTKLRTSNHNLAIETGRWTKTERQHRLCVQCNQHKVEDEMHFLFECPAYTINRKLAYAQIKTKTKIDLTDTHNRVDNLKQLFTSNHIGALDTLGNFVRLSFEQRIN